MTSANAQLYIALQARIAAITINSTAAIPWINQDLGQLEHDNGSGRPAVTFPACTIDIEDSTFENLGDNTQTGNTRICIRLAFPPFSNTSNITPAPYKNAALYYYDLENAIHLALQGWYPGVTTIDDTTDPITTVDLSNTWGHLIRIRTATERRNDTIRVRQLHYGITLIDDTTERDATLIPDITPSLTTIFSIPE